MLSPPPWARAPGISEVPRLTRLSPAATPNAVLASICPTSNSPSRYRYHLRPARSREMTTFSFLSQIRSIHRNRLGALATHSRTWSPTPTLHPATPTRLRDDITRPPCHQNSWSLIPRHDPSSDIRRHISLNSRSSFDPSFALSHFPIAPFLS